MPRAPVESWDPTDRTGRPSCVRRRWRPCGARVFAPLAGRHRRREVVTSLASQGAALAPRGVPPPKRSTRAAANARRPAARDPRRLAPRSARDQAVAPGHGFRGHNPRGSRDRTTIARGVHRCPWARDRTATGAITRPTLLEHAGDLPGLVVLPAGPRSDRAMARGLPRPPGSRVALARGDRASRGRCRLPPATGSCVIRQQLNATFQVTARVAVNGAQGLTCDQTIVLRGPNGPASPATMAALDPQRGQIARCFTALHHNLRLTTVRATSAHAVMPPMGGALITSLRLTFLRFTRGWGLSFPQRRRLLPIPLVDRRSLVEVCHPPPHHGPGGHQR